MKRFTKRIDEHVYYTMGKHSETLPAECTSQDVRQILKHLADYEDSNLTPVEIRSLITTIESLQAENKQYETTVTHQQEAFKDQGKEILQYRRELESQKEEIERNEERFKELLRSRISEDNTKIWKLEAEVKSLKAITELAVKGFQKIIEMATWEKYDVPKQLEEIRSVAQMEIERLSHE